MIVLATAITTTTITTTASAHELRKHGENQPLAPKLHLIMWHVQNVHHWNELLTEKKIKYYYGAQSTTNPQYRDAILSRWQTIDNNWRRAYMRTLWDGALALRYVFDFYASEALRVSWCESRYNRFAKNGQYLGLLQMGASERDTYGHSQFALGQARAGHRYFNASGRDWSPWSCKP